MNNNFKLVKTLFEEDEISEDSEEYLTQREEMFFEWSEEDNEDYIINEDEINNFN